MPLGQSNSVTPGGDTYVCVVLSPLVWGYSTTAPTMPGIYLRIPAKLKADEFSRINVAKSWNSTDYTTDAITQRLAISNAAGNGVGVSITSMGVTSYQKAYRFTDGTTAKTFPMLMVLITVDKGKVLVSRLLLLLLLLLLLPPADSVWSHSSHPPHLIPPAQPRTPQSVTWDDTCKWCSSGNCAVNTYDFHGNAVASSAKGCWVRDTTCGFTSATGVVTPSALCDLHVYVAWTGIDGSGRYFESAVSVCLLPLPPSLSTSALTALLPLPFPRRRPHRPTGSAGC